jgi:hypothetical protein
MARTAGIAVYFSVISRISSANSTASDLSTKKLNSSGGKMKLYTSDGALTLCKISDQNIKIHLRNSNISERIGLHDSIRHSTVRAWNFDKPAYV